MAGRVHTTTKSPSRRREESKEATRSREPPSPIGKGAGRPVAWLAKLQQQALELLNAGHRLAG